jgi:hypothetical protein
MIVVGLFDGNIAVYNLQKNTGNGFCNKFATNVNTGTGFCHKFATNVSIGTGFCNKFAINVNSFSLDILSQAVHRRKSIILYCGPTGSALFIEYFQFFHYK